MYGTDFFDLFSGETITIKDMHDATNQREILAFRLLEIFNDNNLRILFSILRVLYIIALVFLLFGFLTRLAAAIALVLNLIIYYNSPLLIYGYDEFMHLSLLFCTLFSVSSALSLDNLISKKRASVFMILHIKVLLAICYFFSGLSKAIDSTGWWNGQKFLNAIHYRTVIDKNTIFVDFFSNYPLLPILLGIFTVILEIAYPLILIQKRLHITFLYLIILFHLGIAIILQLTAFSIIMIVWNITALYPFSNTSEKAILPQGWQSLFKKKLT
ncbi:HTTM domain-containing protein [Sphingobacterium oryzagri]|uniref:HTTM domain-containing protein n=1 Tax=Sphingobacterium oryzagri TaxID=3025669 RepID=A0ABY7WJ33_9SPHI|nr:HTTM domain-containing protein [Sphingobacterium sp. KACC 22765]WDF69619.1 HTTM domain-containing protein [Sphingobacterium sp. KACC 22765]